MHQLVQALRALVFQPGDLKAIELGQHVVGTEQKTAAAAGHIQQTQGADLSRSLAMLTGQRLAVGPPVLRAVKKAPQGVVHQNSGR